MCESRASGAPAILTAASCVSLKLNIKERVCDEEGGSGHLEKRISRRFYYTDILRLFSISIKLSRSG